ncbi:hypothetical protein [Peptostreptococcus stomatis]|uniref:hypothetical protein n=1 Tax=Peptostreptococcus stomatis TaxID=341694 RepID=UPI003F9F1E0A
MNTDIEKYINSKLEEFEKELDKKREEFRQSLNEEVAQMTKSKTIWDLKTKDEEEYYRLYHNGAIILCAFSSSIDRLFRYLGNAFLTKEEAELERERRKIEAIMRKYSRPSADGKNNYFLVCGHDSKAIDIDYFWNVDYGIPCFESVEIAQKVINEIGEDRLKKYWFGVEE